MRAEARDRRHVAVVGGGIAGLAAAHALLADERSGEAPPLTVTVLEAQQRLGGQVRSERIGEQRLDVGAESLLTRSPAALELCRELGLQAELIAPAQTAMCVWSRGRLRALPPGLLNGMPDGVAPLLRSRILSPVGVGRAALDLLLPPLRIDGDLAVSEIVGRRLGGQALDRLVDPLLGTIYAADCESLSAQASAPQIYRAAREHRSLVRGLRAAGARSGPRPTAAPPPFVSVQGGLERIVERLAHSLSDAEADVRCGAHVTTLTRSLGGRYELGVSGGERLAVDGVVIAAPADQAAAMLEYLTPPAAMQLRSIRCASTVIVTMRYPRSAAREPLRWAGMLVPRSENRLLGALTFMSAKWPHLAADGELWLRCSVSRAGARAALQLDDHELVQRLGAELRQALSLTGDPLQAHVMRWQRSLPLYEPGHLGRIAEVEAALDALPGVVLAGAAYRGIGVPQCIQQGRDAAQRVLRALTDADQSRSNAASTAALSVGS